MKAIFVGLGAAAVGLMIWVAVPAGAIDDLIIPIDSVATGAEGEIIEVANVSVDANLVGTTCMVRVEAENNSSVHPGNDLIISSGSASETFPDVEGSPGQVTTAAGDAVLGDSVIVELQFGPDGITSGGLTIIFDCAAQPPTTTVAPTTSISPATTLPPAAPEPPTAAQPTFTG